MRVNAFTIKRVSRCPYLLPARRKLTFIMPFNNNVVAAALAQIKSMPREREFLYHARAQKASLYTIYVKSNKACVCRFLAEII